MSSLLFTREHEWLRIDDDVITLGITDYAATQLGDVVYADVPKAGGVYEQNGTIGTVESVKAISEIYTPIDCVILESNTDLEAHPERINDDCFGEGWMVRMRATKPEQLQGLMNETEYRRFIGAGE